MAIEWTIEDVEEANPPSGPKHRSSFNLLSEKGAIRPDLVTKAASILEDRDVPHLAVFFQMPSVLSTSGEFVPINLLENTLVAEVLLSPHLLRMDEKGKLIVHCDENDFAKSDRLPIGFPVTQVLAILPYWGRRAEYFPKYENSFRSYKLEDRIVVPQYQSWHQNRPIKASDFEALLPSRMVREMQTLLRSLLPAISISTQTEIHIPELLYNYFVMPVPGRLVRSTYAADLTAYIVNQSSSRQLPLAPKIEAVQQALTVRFREFSRFEQHLFAMRSLARDGELSAAYIGTVGLLEWTLRQYTNQPDKSKIGFREMMKDPVIKSLPKLAVEHLRAAWFVRNDLVHSVPLDRSSLTIAGTHNDRGLQNEDESRSINYKTVDAIIDTAFELYKYMNKEQPGFWSN